MELHDARVRPATTAMIVAKATAAMKASMTVPPVAPNRSVPRFFAMCRAAVLPDGSCALISLAPTSAAAPKPNAMIIR